MQTRVKRIVQSVTSVALVAVIFLTLIFQMTLYTSGNERYFSGDAENYYQSLLFLGFPEDYAVALTELHLLHPTWNFIPLRVTKLNSKYNWNYVIDQETKDEALNLISKNASYSAYWHETNRNQPEAGYYQASRAAVEYFMDPRNFLNEADIFQFYDLSATTTSSHSAVKAVLSGTFMENAKLENGKTYAEYFCEVGAELGINPVYIAVKIRQEQGVGGTSPIISGECGSLLNDYYQNQTQKTESGKDILPPKSGLAESDLLSLNGLYNYYNIGAYGEGVFEIYQRAMLRASEGTPDMSKQWGGSPSWNTRWKSIYGGASFLKKRYIDCYQSTIYLQKFNVDARSGQEFRKQYMAALYGAMSEGKILYQSFASIGALDSEATFLIPVYANMPTEPCADPANATCSRFAIATTQYEYQNEVTSPVRRSAKNETVYAEYELTTVDTLQFSGVFTHTYGVDALEYRLDQGAWMPLSSGKNAEISLRMNFSENTSHILTIRGKASYDHEQSTKKNNVYFLCAVIYLKILPPPQVTLTYQVANTKTEEIIRAGSTLTLPQCNAPDFAGWLGSDGSFLPSGSTFAVKADTSFTAVFLEFDMLHGASLSLDQEQQHLRFSAVLRKDSFELLTARDQNAVRITACIQKDGLTGEETALQPRKTVLSNRVRFDVCTEPLSSADYKAPFSAFFYVKLTYTNGTEATLCASGSDFTRTADFVASSALADQTAQLSEAEIAVLEDIVEPS